MRYSMLTCGVRIAAVLALLPLAAGAAWAAEMRLVEKGVSQAPIIVAESAPQATLDAAKDLGSYIRKISGAQVQVIIGDPDPAPPSAIWVGSHPKLAEVFPGVKLDFGYPEEILQICNGTNLLIAGRDSIVNGKQLEYGTVNAIYTFLEKRLDVRWLWPGKLGEDIIPRDTITLPAFQYRFHPVFRMRHLWPRAEMQWHRSQRIGYDSYTFIGNHAFTDWWEKYHEAHPKWFAQASDGKRPQPTDIQRVKLCMANPEVSQQWLDNAAASLRADPALNMLSASPNDSDGFCCCRKCRTWDPHHASKTDPNRISLTDRHVKFWNILAHGLRQLFPDRTIFVGAYAYCDYRMPPVAETLETNIAIGFVGFFPLTTEANRTQDKNIWKQWANKASTMWYRPNLWYWGGGIWGLPEVAMTKTIEDFRFLADNKCAGIEVDVLRGHWATQGPEYYLMAQLTYDPYQDGVAVMKDYYARGFGPAANEIEQYWTMMERSRDSIVGQPDFKIGSQYRYELPAIFARVWNSTFLARADALLKQAEEKTQGQDIYHRRVAFVRTGYDYTRLVMATVPVMTRVRATGGKDVDAIEQARRNWEELGQVAIKAEIYSIGFSNAVAAICSTHYQGGMQDYFGPPLEALLKKAQQAKASPPRKIGAPPSKM